MWLNAAEEATVRLLETVNHSHLPEPIAVFCDLSLFRSLSLYRSLYVSLSLSLSLSISPTYGISLCFISVSLCVCMCMCVCLLVCYSMCVCLLCLIASERSSLTFMLISDLLAVCPSPSIYLRSVCLSHTHSSALFCWLCVCMDICVFLDLTVCPFSFCRSIFLQFLN